MALAFRNEIPHKNKYRIVVKLGSLAITSPESGILKDKMHEILQDILLLQEEGHEVLIVSSGAINTGRAFIPKKSDDDITYSQACSAVGQPLLMQAYTEILQSHKKSCAQVLLTHEDIKRKASYMNTRNTLLRLIENKIIPIINENDTISFDEIALGDNDQLAAIVAEIVQADILVLLTEADGLYDRDPSLEGATKISQIQFQEDFKDVKTISKSSVGKGGMKTKLQATQKLTPLGIPVLIGTHRQEKPVLRLLTKKEGTFFCPQKDKKLNIKKSRILNSVRLHAAVYIDDGAYEALKKNASLLAVGIRKVSGPFQRGDAIQIFWKSKVVATGLVEYSSKDVDKIKGKSSKEIQHLLDYVVSNVVIHKDQLILK